MESGEFPLAVPSSGELAKIPERDREITGALVALVTAGMQRDQALQDGLLPFSNGYQYFSSVNDTDMSRGDMKARIRAYGEGRSEYLPPTFRADEVFQTVAVFPSVRGFIDPRTGQKEVVLGPTHRGESMFDHFVFPNGTRRAHFVDGQPVTVSSDHRRRELQDDEREQLLLLLQHSREKVDAQTHFEMTRVRNEELKRTGKTHGLDKARLITAYLDEIRAYNARKNAPTSAKRSPFGLHLPTFGFRKKT